jgi:hypothetical protein
MTMYLSPGVEYDSQGVRPAGFRRLDSLCLDYWQSQECIHGVEIPVLIIDPATAEHDRRPKRTAQQKKGDVINE